MSTGLTSGDRNVLLLMAAFIAAWGISGALDVPYRTEVGLFANSDHVITQLARGGPAESVNMQVGDKIIRIDGTDVADTANLVRLPRIEAGERRSYTIVRGDQTIRYRPAYRTLDLRARTLEYLESIVGFAFLLIPLTACLTRPTEATRVLALMGLGLSLSFFDGPYIAVAVSVAQLFMLLGLAAMVHFLLRFPAPRPLLSRSWGRKLIYVPMLIIWLLIAWRVLFTPAADSISVFVSQFFSGIGITLYLLIGLFLLLRNYSRTTREVRKRFALNRMLWGTVAAIIPTVVAQLVRIASPDTPLPGQDYYFAFLVLIPITWSLSAVYNRESPIPAVSQEH
jgi:hypothetical protein